MPTNICRYIRVNGARCGSPSLTGKAFCYYHIRLARQHTPPPVDAAPLILHPIPKDHLDRMQREPILAEYYSGLISANHRATLLELDLPPLEDRHAIQLAISMVINAMAHNRIDLRQATGLLYALQVASSNAKDLIPAPAPHEHPGKIRQTVLHESGFEIALDEDPEDTNADDYHSKGPAARFFEKLEREALEKKERARIAAQQAAEQAAQSAAEPGTQPAAQPAAEQDPANPTTPAPVDPQPNIADATQP